MRCGRTSAALLLLSLVGCAPESILVARDIEDASELDAAGDAQVEAGGDDSALPNHDGATAGDAGGCGDDRECPTGSYCYKPRCGEQQRGICETPRQTCDSNYDPVCSCDGRVNYFNDCLRKSRKVTASIPHECDKPGTGCTPFGRPCPGDEAVCFVLSDGEKPCTFSMASVGKCWIVPDRCQADRSGGDRVQLCGPAGPEGECISSCEAIKSAELWSGSSPSPPVSFATRSLFCSHPPRGASLTP